MGPLAQVGLAFATSIGAWINFVLVLWFARRAGLIEFDTTLKQSIGKLVVAGLALAVVLWLAEPLVARIFASLPRLRNETELIALALIGGCLYGGLALALFGRQWLSILRRRRRSARSGAADRRFRGQVGAGG